MGLDERAFWLRVDRMLEQMQMTLGQMCQKLGLSYNTLNTQRKRNTLPKIEQLYGMASILNTSMEYLLTGKNLQILTTEAKAVNESEELQALVRAVIRDPKLLRIISAVVESSEKTIRSVNIG